ncbi:MAG: 5-formyltetrahydrofolate cyclo-ligase [Bdellovibrionales bacterium]|nr:5-formyltetrahydrofolate cyclo-ligase [Bdellovibrionales bacterium]
MTDPSTLREQVRNRRKNLSPAERESFSKNLSVRFLTQVRDYPWKGKVVALFRPMAEEWGLQAIETFLEETGAKIVYPKTSGDQMEFFWVSEPSSTLWTVGQWGIQEPSPRAPKVDFSEIQVVFVPAVVLGPKGQRIGMGKGFYDRALPKFPQALRVSLAASFQVVPSDSKIQIEERDWDQRVDWVVSSDTEFRNENVARFLSGQACDDSYRRDR